MGEIVGGLVCSFSSGRLRRLMRVGRHCRVVSRKVAFSCATTTVHFGTIYRKAVHVGVQFLRAIFSSTVKGITFSVFVSKVHRPNCRLMRNLTSGRRCVFSFTVKSRLGRERVRFMHRSRENRTSVGLVSLRLRNRLINAGPESILVRFLKSSIAYNNTGGDNRRNGKRISSNACDCTFLSTRTLNLSCHVMSGNNCNLGCDSDNGDNPECR